MAQIAVGIGVLYGDEAPISPRLFALDRFQIGTARGFAAPLETEGETQLPAGERISARRTPENKRTTQVKRTIRISKKFKRRSGGQAGRCDESPPGQNQNDNVLLTLHVRSGGMRNVPHEPSGLEAIGISSSLALRFRTFSETTQFTALPMSFSFRR